MDKADTSRGARVAAGIGSRYFEVQSIEFSYRGVDGICLALRLGAMRPRRQLPLPDFRHRPVQNLPLDLDAGQVAMSGKENPPDDAFRPGQRVLLLEDRDDFREVLHDYLVSRSFQVTPVPSGVEGLREIIKDPFDLIVCDMMMPRVGGEMFYWAVTRVRPAAGQRFIFFTGHKNNPRINFFFPASERDGALQALQAGGARLGDPRCCSQAGLTIILRMRLHGIS